MRSAFALAGLALLATVNAARADGAAPAHKLTQSESYIMLEPMYATVLDSGKPSGLLMVAIGLDIPDAWLRGQAEHALPILRDDYVRSLMSYTAAAVRLDRQPDVVDIAKRLQRVTDRALQKPGARVLLAEVALRVTH
jgi:flagellar basal body-associated protein FliL